MNQYESAISHVGRILLEYDTDKMVPAYGFGFRYQGKVHHCFPLTREVQAPEVHGIDGLCQAYR